MSIAKARSPLSRPDLVTSPPSSLVQEIDSVSVEGNTKRKHSQLVALTSLCVWQVPRQRASEGRGPIGEIAPRARQKGRRAQHEWRLCGYQSADMSLQRARLLLLVAAWLCGPTLTAGRRYELALRDQTYTDVPPLRTVSGVSSALCALLCAHQVGCNGLQYSGGGGECALLGSVPAGAGTAAAAGTATYLADCPSGWFPAPGACYLFSSETVVWADVAARCAALQPGASIAAMRTEEQLAAIRAQLGGTSLSFSIGIQRGADGSWQHMDGTAATVLPWAAGQPGASETCTGLYGPAIELHDTSCGATPFLCGIEV